MKRVLALILLHCTFTLTAQVTFVLESIPDYTPPGDDIFIAGNFNQWVMGEEDYKLTKNNSDQWQITLTGFNDGETIIGYVLGYSPDRQGFIMTPADLSGNNERIFVVKTAIKHVTFL